MSDDRSDTTDLVSALRAVGEMPLEGGAVDPLIDVMNSLAHRAADEIERLRALVRRLHEPAWAEIGPAAQDIDDEFADVLPNALKENQGG